jgi:hypothetical protein
MKRFLLPAVIFISLLISCNSSKTPTHDQMMEKATRSEKNGWIVLHLEGAPEVIGYQHGYLLADEIVDLRGAMEMYYLNSTEKPWDFYRTESAVILVQNANRVPEGN